MLIHVTHLPLSGLSATAEVQVARHTSLYGVLMQARSQSLEFDLDVSDVFLNDQEVHASDWRKVALDTDGRVTIKARPQETVLV